MRVLIILQWKLKSNAEKRHENYANTEDYIFLGFYPVPTCSVGFLDCNATQPLDAQHP